MENNPDVVATHINLNDDTVEGIKKFLIRTVFLFNIILSHRPGLMTLDTCLMSLLINLKNFVKKITKVHARQIIDSRGNPTIEAEVIVDHKVIEELRFHLEHLLVNMKQ